MYFGSISIQWMSKRKVVFSPFHSFEAVWKWERALNGEGAGRNDPFTWEVTVTRPRPRSLTSPTYVGTSLKLHTLDTCSLYIASTGLVVLHFLIQFSWRSLSTGDTAPSCSTYDELDRRPPPASIAQSSRLTFQNPERAFCESSVQATRRI